MSVAAPISTPQYTKKQIEKALWVKGELGYLMTSVQKELYETYKGAAPNATLVWLLARQTGKTYCIALIAIMEALKTPRCGINILTDTKLHMEEIIIPKFEEILQHCPEELKPEYNKQRFKYTFPNGSSINLAGSDAGNAEKLRGKTAKLVIVDEAGFCNNLRKIVLETLLPTTTHTGGKLILSSTPPESYDHDFNQFVEEAELEGYLTKKTVYENPLLTQEQLNAIIKRYPGGVNDFSFRREYMCEMLKDPQKAVFPEVDDNMLAAIVRVHPKPSFYTPYVGMDIGFKDLTVVLFGYHDFRANKIVIEREIVRSGSELQLKKFSEDILRTEDILWTNILTNEKNDPKMRTSDIEPIVTQEIYTHSGKKLYFTPVTKERGYKLPLINHIRMMLCSNQIVIDPSCKTLISHLKNGKWTNSSRDDFERSPKSDKDGIPAGHYDAIDALLYMIKGMDLNYNPVPAQFRDRKPDFLKNPDSYNQNSHTPAEVFKAIFGNRNKKR
jgi:hypothetical protein